MEKKIRVTVWNEYRHEANEDYIREIYPDGIHGCIKAFLGKYDNLEVRTATLDEPDHGLPDEVLNNTDVLMWWGHIAHAEVSDALVEKIKYRVWNDGMGFIAMHSAHYSKAFRGIVGTSGRLRWGDNQREILWNVMPAHPIMAGIPEYFELPAEEMYGEPFLIPQPDELVMMSWFEQGYLFRSGCTFFRGRGKVFYFQPGHEECPTYYNEIIQKILYNGILWAAPNDFGSPLNDGERCVSIV